MAIKTNDFTLSGINSSLPCVYFLPLPFRSRIFFPLPLNLGWPMTVLAIRIWQKWQCLYEDLQLCLGLLEPELPCGSLIILLEGPHGEALRPHREEKGLSWAQPRRYPCQGTRHVNEGMSDSSPAQPPAEYHQGTTVDAMWSGRITWLSPAQIPDPNYEL